MNFAIIIFFWFDCYKKSHNLLQPSIWLLILVAWIDSRCEKCTIDQLCLDFVSLNICKWTWKNITKQNFVSNTLYCKPFFSLFHYGCEFELKLVAMCTIWIWTWVGCYVHNVNLNFSYLPCAQNVNCPRAFYGWNSKFMKISQWQKSVLVCWSTHQLPRRKKM
jgi:hypothetical protein